MLCLSCRAPWSMPVREPFPAGRRTIASSHPRASTRHREIPAEIERFAVRSTNVGWIADLLAVPAFAPNGVVIGRVTERKTNPFTFYDSHNPIIIALDVETAEQARTLVAQLGTEVDFYKVGLELYASAGMDFVSELIAEGKQVFLDLKMYDIDETVKRAVAQVAKRGVRFLTVHAVENVIRAAVEGKGSSELALLAVTVLTDTDQRDLHRMGLNCTVEELVVRRAQTAVELGVDGLVCSPLEVAQVRRIAGPQKILVTPGVRSAGASSGDQKRVATPEQAIADGADYLVIGRQVTRSADPRAEVTRILDALPT